nr:MAG TPA: hypothetical protein [Caudoviricetes sp.]
MFMTGFYDLFGHSSSEPVTDSVYLPFGSIRVQSRA